MLLVDGVGGMAAGDMRPQGCGSVRGNRSGQHRSVDIAALYMPASWQQRRSALLPARYA
jgi:hypothetical protein